MENWKVGKNRMTVITDNDDGLKESTGHAGEDAKKYYGGNLICESIWREKDANLIAAAPRMLEALQIATGEIEKYPIKFTREEKFKIMRDAISCALGNEA